MNDLDVTAHHVSEGRKLQVSAVCCCKETSARGLKDARIRNDAQRALAAPKRAGSPSKLLSQRTHGPHTWLSHALQMDVKAPFVVYERRITLFMYYDPVANLLA